MEPGMSVEPSAFARPAAGIAADEGRRWLGGLLLAAVFGLALGARLGGLALLQHALGVPAGLCATGLLGVPPLYVLLTLFDAPISLSEIASWVGRALSSIGAVLGGLAPAVALLAVTIQSADVAGFAARFGLAIDCAIGGDRKSVV